MNSASFPPPSSTRSANRWKTGSSGSAGHAARSPTRPGSSSWLLDRFDLAVRVDPPDPAELVGRRRGECSATVADRVLAARERAALRGVSVNAELAADTLDEVAPLDDGARRLLERHLRSGVLSARGLHRVHRLARTLADLDGDAHVLSVTHVSEALFLRGGRGLLLGDGV
jgi:magnesium chelatase family protein